MAASCCQNTNSSQCGRCLESYCATVAWLNEGWRPPPGQIGRNAVKVRVDAIPCSRARCDLRQQTQRYTHNVTRSSVTMDVIPWTARRPRVISMEDPLQIVW